MRALLCLSMVVSASHVAVRAQAPSTQALNPEMDFSGVYVGVRAFQKPDVYPFTAEGERALSAHDPLVGDPSRYDCVLEDMPRVLLWGVTVMQIAHEDGRIEMSVERGDTVRSIHMDGTAPPADQPHTEVGHSVGHWVGDVLTVETTHLAGGVMFADEGHPVSRQTRITERYWRNPGENDLQMELVIHDSVNYTQPVRFEREWIWTPDERVHPYNCFSLELDESEPVDIDELKRRLEQL